MGIFSRILDKLRHHDAPAGGPAGQQTSGGGDRNTIQQGQGASDRPNATFQQSAEQRPQETMQNRTLSNVDVDAVLQQMAAKKGGGGNYRESIVDLLKLLDLDSSLDARKELAQELNVNAGAHGSAEQNIALQKAVMKKLAENGGKVPESLKD
jgi:hypothetical protein